MHILLALILNVSAPAFTEAELQSRKDTLAKVNIAFSDADSRLPPCAGLDRTSEEALRIEPARDCPRAQVFYSRIVKLDRHLRDSCRELERMMETTLTDPRYCERREQPGWLAESQHKLSEIIQRNTDVALEHMAGEDELLDGLDGNDQPAKGEFARMSCALPITIGSQFRKKQLALLKKHLVHADAALSESCSGQRVPGEDFLRYMREGP